jgi:hypothetical protein
MTIRAIQITLSPMVWRIDLQQLVSGADPTHKLARCDAHSSSAMGHVWTVPAVQEESDYQ